MVSRRPILPYLLSRLGADSPVVERDLGPLPDLVSPVAQDLYVTEWRASCVRDTLTTTSRLGRRRPPARRIPIVVMTTCEAKANFVPSYDLQPPPTSRTLRPGRLPSGPSARRVPLRRHYSPSIHVIGNLSWREHRCATLTGFRVVSGITPRGPPTTAKRRRPMPLVVAMAAFSAAMTAGGPGRLVLIPARDRRSDRLAWSARYSTDLAHGVPDTAGHGVRGGDKVFGARVELAAPHLHPHVRLGLQRCDGHPVGVLGRLQPVRRRVGEFGGPVVGESVDSLDDARLWRPRPARLGRAAAGLRPCR